MEDIDRYIKDDEDIAFEFELQSTPTNHKTWERYLSKWKQQLKNNERTFNDLIWLYQRYALQFREDSDVWNEYINWLIEEQLFSDYHGIIDCYDQAMHSVKGKFEVISIQYLKYAIGTLDIKVIVKALNDTLPVVPKQTHYKLWNLILEFIQSKIIPILNDNAEDSKSQLELFEEIVRNVIKHNTDTTSTEEVEISSNASISELLERYLVVSSKDNRVDVLTMLGSTRDWVSIKRTFEYYLFPSDAYDNISSDDAPYSLCILYLECLHHFGKTSEAKRIKFSNFIEKTYPFSWINLRIMDTELLLKTGQFSQLEKFLDDALAKTKSVKDFETIFALHINVEQAIVETALKVYETADKSNSSYIEELITNHIQYLNNLTKSYAVKLNDFHLRKNVNDIGVWIQRVNIYSSLTDKCSVYADAILRIDPLKVKTPGYLGEFWCSYARLYWDNTDIDSARELYEKALQVPFPHLKDLEVIWMNWMEKELVREGADRVISLLDKALVIPENALARLEQFRNRRTNIPSQSVIFSSLKMWTFYLDLLESAKYSEDGLNPKLYKDVKHVYDSMINLRIITPLLFTSYAKFAKLNNDREKCLQIYDRAVSSFPPTVSYDIWKIYLKDVMELSVTPEHIRDLFDSALSNLTPQGIDTKEIYLLGNTFEENTNGITQGSIAVLLGGARDLKEKFVGSKLELWDLAIEKTKTHFGLEAARPLYEECITEIPCDRSSKYIISFADIEVVLGETVRAREILKYGSTLLPPARNDELWSYWEMFEVNNGDKQTYKDMVKLKMKLEVEMKVDTEHISQENGNVEFVSSKKQKTQTNPETTAAESNPEEIDLDL